MNIDSEYVNHWGKPKPKFTEQELAVMEGGHSLEETSSSMSFLKEIITEAKVSVKDQILADIKKQGGNVNDYYIRFTNVNQLGFSPKQAFGRSPDIDDPAFDAHYIGRGKGKPALWFYPLSYYLKDSTYLYGTEHPYVWLVKLKSDAWLQPVNYKTNEVKPAPAGKERVGLLRLTNPPAAIFFKHGWNLVGTYYNYSTQHQRHGHVRGAPKQEKPSIMKQLLSKFKNPFSPDETTS